MSVLEKLACFKGRGDEVPNQELARELVATRNADGIREVADNLFNRDRNIQSDCIKVMYEIGYLEPELIADYVGDFFRLLESKNNRAVWGSMLALSTVARLRADEIYEKLEQIIKSMKTGSVITVDNGVKVLAAVASSNDRYSQAIFPYLLDHLKNCRPKELGQHAESILTAVNDGNRGDFISVLHQREGSLTPSQQARISKLYKRV